MEFTRVVVQVIEIKWLGASFVQLRLHRPPDFVYEPGQHCSIEYSDRQGGFERVYSIASAPHELGELVFCIQAGVDSRTLGVLKSLQPGVSVKLGSPQGSFKLRSASRRVLCVAGGSGVAPMRSFLMHLSVGVEPSLSSGDRPVLLLGSRDAGEIPFFDELKSLPIDIRFSAVTGTRAGVVQGTVLTLFDGVKEQLPVFEAAYLCGSPGMVQAVRAWLTGAGFPAENIVVEQY